jgi:tetratricopeptide (TPR) repeat protein
VEHLISYVSEIENFEKNLNIGNILNILREIKKSKGKYNEALKYYKQSLKIRKKSLPKYHPDIAISYNNIGNVFQHL